MSVAINCTCTCQLALISLRRKFKVDAKNSNTGDHHLVWQSHAISFFLSSFGPRSLDKLPCRSMNLQHCHSCIIIIITFQEDFFLHKFLSHIRSLRIFPVLEKISRILCMCVNSLALFFCNHGRHLNTSPDNSRISFFSVHFQCELRCGHNWRHWTLTFCGFFVNFPAFS